MANSLKPVAVYAITDSMTTVYTVPGATTFTVSMLHLCNTSASAVTVRVCIGGSSSTNALMWDYSIAAKDTVELLKGDMWATGTTLQVSASLTNVVTLKLAGIETT